LKHFGLAFTVILHRLHHRLGNAQHFALRSNVGRVAVYDSRLVDALLKCADVWVTGGLTVGEGLGIEHNTVIVVIVSVLHARITLIGRPCATASYTRYGAENTDNVGDAELLQQSVHVRAQEPPELIARTRVHTVTMQYHVVRRSMLDHLSVQAGVVDVKRDDVKLICAGTPTPVFLPTLLNVTHRQLAHGAFSSCASDGHEYNTDQ
jgi:hypothetical protein